MTGESPADRAGAADPAFELEVRRQLPVQPERAFAAWTDPDEIVRWWGPEGVRCIGAEIDLRVGGAYRIGNELPDRRILWIEGIFEVVDSPHRLAYTWSTGSSDDVRERIEVQFVANRAGTELVVRHRRVPTEELLEQHRSGWLGCLAGLSDYLAGAAP